VILSENHTEKLFANTHRGKNYTTHSDNNGESKQHTSSNAESNKIFASLLYSEKIFGNNISKYLKKY